MSLRKKLGKIHGLRSTFHFVLALRERFHRGDEGTVRKWLENAYENEDPWKYTSSDQEIARLQNAVRMLDRARGNSRFARAFEVGCSEGVFTSMLAERCDSLTAVDLLPAAISRAKGRCAGMPIAFQEWDVRHSPAPHDMDLVVVMDVLELFFRPADVRAARNKLVTAVRPGGYLLVGDSRQNVMFETSWWGKWLLRGGLHIVECFTEHAALERVQFEIGPTYVNALFRVK